MKAGSVIGEDELAELFRGRSDAGAVYERIADAIAAGVTGGRLAAGDRLPPHRTLARHLGLAVPTVSRGYREAERRGLIVSAVGRGTFVAGIPHLRDTPTDPAGWLDMAVNAPARGEHEHLLRAALEDLSAARGAGALLGYGSDIGRFDHREAACAWLARSGLEVEPGQVAICHGGQHALLVALGATMRAGDVLLTEALTYSGVKSVAQLLGIRLAPVAMDANGLLPDALDAACAASRPRALYCMPTAHNPTTVTLSARRRRAIVEIARKHDVALIEDDVFGLLVEETGLVPLAALAPERTLYVTSLSKSLAPGLRCGFLAAPPELLDRVGAVIRASVFNPAPIEAEIALGWLRDGTADRLLDWQRVEASKRRAVAERSLRGAVRRVSATALHAWVELREPWTEAEVVGLAASIGIGIGSSAFFRVDPEAGERWLRLCLGNAADPTVLGEALRRLAGALERGPTWAV